MKHYAQINAEGVCFSRLKTHGTIDAPNMIEVDGDADTMGKRWDGAAWQDVAKPAPTAAELAAAELQTIDKATGMSRTMREAFIVLGVKVGADVTYLQQQETKAAAARLKLK